MDDRPARRLLAPVAFIGAVALAACGPAETPATPQPPATSHAPQTSQTPDASVLPGGTFGALT